MITISDAGRILFGLYFLYSGINHFLYLEMMAGYASSKKVPSPKSLTFLTGVLLVVGGLGVATGMYLQTSAILLLAFLIPTTFIMHAFWSEQDISAKMNDRVSFFKNLALIGALLMLLV